MVAIKVTTIWLPRPDCLFVTDPRCLNMVDNVNLLEGVRLIQFVVANDDHPVINVEIIGIPLLDLEKG